MAAMSAVCSSQAPCLSASRVGRMQRSAATPQAAGLRSATALRSMPALERSTLSAPTARRSGAAVCQAMPFAEVAGEFAEISGYATVMFAITLVGLAAGFVLLRFEALVEEGKLDDVLK